jgi:Ca2+/H+ antiporter
MRSHGIGHIHLGEGSLEGAVITRKINILLLAIPLVLFGDQVQTFIETTTGLSISEGMRFGVTFALAAVALIPLAGFVESAVEELAELLGPFVGGLLHTTFGNVAELTIALAVLLSFTNSGGAEIVEGSIAGVIIRNSLLFLGLATLLGCLRNGHMKFDAENASEYSTVFALAVVGLSIPTIVKFLPLGAVTVAKDLVLPDNIPLPGFLAVVLIVSYLAYIGFAVFRLGEGYDLVEIRKQKRLERQKRRRAKRKNFHQRLEALEQPFPIAAQPDTQALFSAERLSAEERLREDQSHAASSGRVNGRRVYAKAGLIAEKRRKRAEQRAGGFLSGQPVFRGRVALGVLEVDTAGVATKRLRCLPWIDPYSDSGRCRRALWIRWRCA